MKLTVKGEFFEVVVEGETDQEVIRKAAFWHSLPTTCPVDNPPTPVKFGYAKRKGYDFYYLESTGEKKYEYSIGERIADKVLFPGEYEKEEGKTYLRWRYWNGKESVVVWEDGKLLTSPIARPVPTTDATVELTEEQKADIELENLGIEYYGADKWPGAKEHNTKRIMEGRMGKPTKEDISRMIDGLKKLQAKRQQAGGK